ncbi:hypothetical protein DPMN_100466 [Dreissena polymorpha]|uniref:Uncharacterized protein n=1 Tax=Dreissena polymorpha TaxID=45954 RepID=A0A9D4R7F6_DREPO|nr:hypothetical protein DPMN_100466 [Dreissena polymorpha]
MILGISALIIRKPSENCPSPSSHVIQLTGTIFELNSRIKETNVLSKFHENWTKNVTSTRKMPRPLAAMFFHRSRPFHDDWAKIVTSRVFTRENCHYIHIEKNAPPTGGHENCPQPTGGHVFQLIGTTFELNQDIIKTNILTNFELGRDFIGTKLLTKFHEDGTRNQMLTDGRTDGGTYDGKRPVTKAHLSNQVI